MNLTSIVVSTIAFFVASFYLKRYFDQSDLPQGMTRNTLVFALALIVSYAIGWAVDHIV
jgi:hypothetical protein